jgi:membrane protease YdiL (CAAX protease family)
MGGVGTLLRRTFSARGIAPIWYLPILLTGPLLLLLSYWIMRGAGMPLPEPQIPLLAVPVFFVVAVIGAAGEEPGWMGYAADPLQARWGALPTALVLGLAWAAMHAVPWIQVHGLEWAAWQALSTISLRILIVWLYDNTGKSILAAILCHAMVNVAEALFPNLGSHYDPAIFGSLTTIAAAAVIYLYGAQTLARYRFGATAGRDLAPGRPGTVGGARPG